MITDSTPSAVWNITNQVFTIWEYSFDAILSLIPDEIEPVEVRPGRTLLCIGAARYAPGHYGENSAGFNELVLMVLTVADLSIAMPQPRYSFYSIQVLTDSQDFIDHKALTIHVPATLDKSLNLDFHKDKAGFSARNSQGDIFSVSSNIEKLYNTEKFYGQYFSLFDNKVRNGAWYWQGAMYEDMNKPDSYELNLKHGFFNDLNGVKPASFYRQMYLQPETGAETGFFKLS